MWNPPPPVLQLDGVVRNTYIHDNNSPLLAKSPPHSHHSHGHSHHSQPQHPPPSHPDSLHLSPNNTYNTPTDVNTNNAHNPDTSTDYHHSEYGSPIFAGLQHSMVYPSHNTTRRSSGHPKIRRVAPYLIVAALQAYTILTVVRCLADPTWISYPPPAVGQPPLDPQLGRIGLGESVCLGLAIFCTFFSCVGVTLRITDKLPWLRRIPVITAFLEAIFCAAALGIFLSSHTVKTGGQYSHGFLTCVITVIFSSIVALLLTVDWWRGFPSPCLSANIKALIIASFVMTTVVIIGAGIYYVIEDWSFDMAVNFCIVSNSTIGYGDISPKTTWGQIVFFFYGLIGISSMGYFVVSLRNAVIEQFQWKLLDEYARPQHMTRVQTRMSQSDVPLPVAKMDEESRVKTIIKRKMILLMVSIWFIMWFGGATVFFFLEEDWSYLEALYFCFVTLTTIGFGDFTPTQPASIEFWNVYVFIGLAVFAYVLSLSSESMASNIHLVDDQGLMDGGSTFYGWEGCEGQYDDEEDDLAGGGGGQHYPSNLGTIGPGIGLEGLKWRLVQPSVDDVIPPDQTIPGVEPEPPLHQNMQQLMAGQIVTDSGRTIQWQRRPSVAPTQGGQLPANRHNSQPDMRDENNSNNNSTTFPRAHTQFTLSRHSSLFNPSGMGNNNRNHSNPSLGNIHSNNNTVGRQGRVLLVTAKERRQMLEAEHYATQYLPTYVKFKDSQGGTHLRAVRPPGMVMMSRSNLASPSASGVGGNSQGGGDVDYENHVSPHTVSGAYQNLGRPNKTHSRLMGVSEGGTMYCTSSPLAGASRRPGESSTSAPGAITTESIAAGIAAATSTSISDVGTTGLGITTHARSSTMPVTKALSTIASHDSETSPGTQSAESEGGEGGRGSGGSGGDGGGNGGDHSRLLLRTSSQRPALAPRQTTQNLLTQNTASDSRSSNYIPSVYEIFGNSISRAGSPPSGSTSKAGSAQGTVDGHGNISLGNDVTRVPSGAKSSRPSGKRLSHLQQQQGLGQASLELLFSHSAPPVQQQQQPPAPRAKETSKSPSMASTNVTSPTTNNNNNTSPQLYRQSRSHSLTSEQQQGQGTGPTANEIHQWLAETAGTLSPTVRLRSPRLWNSESADIADLVQDRFAIPMTESPAVSPRVEVANNPLVAMIQDQDGSSSGGTGGTQNAGDSHGTGSSRTAVEATDVEELRSDNDTSPPPRRRGDGRDGSSGTPDERWMNHPH